MDDPRSDIEPAVTVRGDHDGRGKRKPDHTYQCATCGSTIHADDPAALRAAARRHVATHQEA